MSRAHTFYFQLSLKNLQEIVEAHQAEFDLLLEDNFSDEELTEYEKFLDGMAALYVQPILSELSFDDFYHDASLESEQRNFFKNSRSSVAIENMPYFESNPFQVSYLLKFLHRFDEVLIDQGGVSELVFLDVYLSELRKFKSMDSLFSLIGERKIEVKTTRPVDPIDFLVLDVYKELNRLKMSGLLVEVEALLIDQNEKLKRIFMTMKEEQLDSSTVFKKTGLIPKDFDDHLERLKFWLRKQ